MTITLYNTADEPNRVIKTLGTGEQFAGSIRDTGSVDVVNPTVLIESGVPAGVNYAYIDVFDRYYYIDEITAVRTGLSAVRLRCDPLMSFSADIMQLAAIAKRVGTTDYNQYSKYIEDGRQEFQAFHKVLAYDMGDLETAGSVPYILATVST